MDSSNRADADETSGGLYQEINETGVALKNVNLSQVEQTAAPPLRVSTAEILTAAG